MCQINVYGYEAGIGSKSSLKTNLQRENRSIESAASAQTNATLMCPQYLTELRLGGLVKKGKEANVNKTNSFVALTANIPD